MKCQAAPREKKKQKERVNKNPPPCLRVLDGCAEQSENLGDLANDTACKMRGATPCPIKDAPFFPPDTPNACLDVSQPFLSGSEAKKINRALLMLQRNED